MKRKAWPRAARVKASLFALALPASAPAAGLDLLSPDTLLISGDIPEDAGRGPHPAPFDKKLTTRIGVMFPATSRGTRLELWDRATDRRYPLAWPPVSEPVRTQSKDGG